MSSNPDTSPSGAPGTGRKALARITEAQDTSWRGVMRRLAELIEP